MSTPESHEDRTDDRTGRGPNPNERGKWISGLLALLGVWMVLQAFMLDLAATQVWNDVAVGAVLFAVGAYNYTRRSDERLASVAAAMIAALVGLWLVATPFMFGTDTAGAETVNDLGFWNDVVIGLLALGLGAYSAYKARDRRTATRTTTPKT